MHSEQVQIDIQMINGRSAMKPWCCLFCVKGQKIGKLGGYFKLINIFSIVLQSVIL